MHARNSALARVCGLTLCCLVALPTGAYAPADNTGAAFSNRVLELTNVERRKAGLPPLVFEGRLATSAHWKAEDMAKRNYFDHADGKGRDFIDRAQDFGYKEWHYLGENIAAGQTSPEEVVAEWMASPGHRKNILSASIARSASPMRVSLTASTAAIGCKSSARAKS